GFNSEDINEIRVIDAKYRIRATSVLDNQSLVGQRSMEDSVRRSVSSEQPYEMINFDQASGKRVMVRVTPIMNNKEVVGTLYVTANIEKVFKQIDEINQILAGGVAVSLSITIVIGIF